MRSSRILWIWLSCGLALGGVWIAAAATLALAREWTDNTGKFKIDADFVSVENGVVTLKKSDGQTIHMPLEKLCDADRQFVAAQAAAPAGENPFGNDSSPPPAHKSPAAKGPAAETRPIGAAALALPKGVDAAAAKQAEEAMNDLFKSELAEARTSAKRTELAKQLLQTAKDTKDDPASQFVLLRKGAELAAAGGDVETASAAVGQLETVLHLNARPLAVEVLETLSRQSKVDHRALAKAAEPLIDRALADDDFDAAAKMATVMVGAARSAKDLSQLKIATGRMTDISALREEQKKIVPAREKLETTPLDPEANRIVGHFLCFVKRDWEHGIPMLSLGDDESLKKIASEELKENKTGGEMMALGDSWDALAHGRHGAAAKERADYWYRQALPLVTGVAKLKLEKRLAVAGGSGSTNSLGMKLVRIPAGEFDIGESETTEMLQQKFPYMRHSNGGWSMGKYTVPLHHVRITKPFLMAIYPVTVRQFRAFVDDDHYVTDAERAGRAMGWDETTGRMLTSSKYSWRDPGYPQLDDFPVVETSWNDASAFCNWLSRKENQSYRLPTSAQWEYACRAGTKTRFYYGDDPEKMVAYGNTADASLSAKTTQYGHAIRGNDGYVFASPVGKFQPNAWGLYDMHGNVAQFCQDWADQSDELDRTVDDPAGPKVGVLRVVRGSGWYCDAMLARAGAYYKLAPSMPQPGIGFRVIREVP